jgi:imidazole glycerol-phosphate synthase subunit HisH
MVVIIDYGMGNVLSVQKALNVLKVPNMVSGKEEDIVAASHLILPGVGSFKKAMDNLHAKELVPVLKKEVMENKKPFLGICLGMQLLAEKGFENGETQGLGYIPGAVHPIPDNGLPATHIGWNNISIQNDTFFKELTDNNFYFVHSYHFVPAESTDIAATVEYGCKLTAAVQRDNVFGTQFHPEKSQQEGIRVIKYFLDHHA